MKHIFFLTTLCLFLSARPTHAQTDTTKATSQHFLGLHAGMSTGTGFSYRYTKKRFGIQLTGIPIFNNGLQYASAGYALTYRPFLKPEHEEEKLQFLIYNGSHIVVYDYLSTAIGFGIEKTFAKNFNFNVMVGYGLNFTNNLNTVLSVETGIHYKLR